MQMLPVSLVLFVIAVCASLVLQSRHGLVAARSTTSVARELNIAKKTIEELKKENELLRSCASTSCIKRLGLDDKVIACARPRVFVCSRCRRVRALLQLCGV